MGKRMPEIKEGLPDRKYGRDRIATYIAEQHLISLREVSRLAQLPIGRILI